MKRSKPKTRWLLVSILIVASALTYFGYRYFMIPTPQQADIFLISTPLEYGNTTLSGIIQKDSPVGEDGNYYLSMTDGHVIALVAKGIDAIIGREVMVSGYLAPKVDESSLPQMKVESMKTSD